MPNRIITGYHRLLREEYRLSVEALAAFRIAFASAYLLLIGVPSFSWLAEVPEFFYAPQDFSIARFYAEYIPSTEFLVVLDGTILLALIFVLFGFRTTAASLILALALLVGYSMKFSTGKIGHGIMLVVLPGIMAFSGWGRAWSLDQKLSSVTSSAARSPSGYVPFIVALVLGFAMFTAGVSKWRGGWLLPDHFGTFYHFNFRYYFWEGKQQYLAPYVAGGLPAVGWKLLDYVTLGFELLFLPAVLNKRIFQVFCFAAVLFHIATLLIFNIPYINNLLAYLLFIRWDGVIAWMKRSGGPELISRWISVRSLVIVSVLFVCQHIVFLFLFNDNLLRDKLISPISAITLFTEADFRDIRGPVLLFLALLVAVGQWMFSRRAAGLPASPSGRHVS